MISNFSASSFSNRPTLTFRLVAADKIQMIIIFYEGSYQIWETYIHKQPKWFLRIGRVVFESRPH